MELIIVGGILLFLLACVPMVIGLPLALTIAAVMVLL